MNKSARIGMRIAPETKDRWEATAKQWGYKGTSAWIEAMCDWAIQVEKNMKEKEGEWK